MTGSTRLLMIRCAFFFASVVLACTMRYDTARVLLKISLLQVHLSLDPADLIAKPVAQVLRHSPVDAMLRLHVGRATW